MQEKDVRIRAAVPEDAQALLDIYCYYVQNTAVTSEHEVPTEEEFRSRIARVLEYYPYLVAECDGEIIGYAYASRFHPRAAYAWTVEMSIYLKKDMRRGGLGRRLYGLLEAILAKQNVVKAIACIIKPTDELANFNSAQFHERLGYRTAGVLAESGYKFGRWYSVLYMDKSLGKTRVDMPPTRAFAEVRGEFGL